MAKTEEKTFDYSRKNAHHLVIYYHDGAKQIVHPSVAFDGNWKLLASTISGGVYDKYEVR